MSNAPLSGIASPLSVESDVAAELKAMQAKLETLSATVAAAQLPGAPPMQPRDLAKAMTQATSLCSQVMDIAASKK